MNPILAKKIEIVEEQVQALSELLQGWNADRRKALDSNEKMLKDKWRDQKEINTLRRANDEYDDLLADHENVLESHERLQERLTVLLSFSKALHESLEESA